MRHSKRIFFALVIITHLLGCDMFQDRIFDPPPDPLVIAEAIIGSWEIVSIEGEPVEYALGTRYADWYFDDGGSWEIYLFWDYGALKVEAFIQGSYELEGDFFILTIPDDDGFFELEPGESFIKGTVTFEGKNRLTLWEQGGDMVVELERLFDYLDNDAVQ